MLWNTLWKSGAFTVAKSYGIKALNGSIDGLDELLAKLDMFPEEAAMAAEDGIKRSTNNIVTAAKMAVTDGEISQNITTEVERRGPKISGSVFVQQGGYVHPLWPVFFEMGTGPKGIASGGDKYPLPASAYTQHPWRYYNTKLGHVVTTSGRYAQPFLWPSYLAEKPYVITNVKDAVRLYLAKKGGGGK
jgi:hypothetical protein